MTLLNGLACMVVITSRMIVAMEDLVAYEETVLLKRPFKGFLKSVGPTDPLFGFSEPFDPMVSSDSSSVATLSQKSTPLKPTSLTHFSERSKLKRTTRYRNFREEQKKDERAESAPPCLSRVNVQRRLPLLPPLPGVQQDPLPTKLEDDIKPLPGVQQDPLPTKLEDDIKPLDLQNIGLAVRVPPMSDSDLQRIRLELLFQQKSAVPLVTPVVTPVILTPNQTPKSSFSTPTQATFQEMDGRIFTWNIRGIPRDNQN